MDGYYRIRFDGLALNGRATVRLEGGRIYGIKGEGQYDLAGRYRRQAEGRAIDIELEVHVPGGTYDGSNSPAPRSLLAFLRNGRVSRAGEICFMMPLEPLAQITPLLKGCCGLPSI